MTIKGAQGLRDEGTGFALGVGGGLEVNAKNRFGVRLFQIDYIPRRFDGDWRHNLRIAAGFTIRLNKNHFVECISLN